MKQITFCSGREYKEMFTAGSSWLEKSVPEVNAINVFPVPDGDTGTNMHLTLRSTIEEAERAVNGSVSEIARAMAQGALMGARGNSGVILSQFFRGLAKGLEKKEQMNGSDWAKALQEATTTAYKGLSQPTEGTILTVIKDAANAAREMASKKGDDITVVMEAAVSAAKESVARTPELLPVLKDAGVVDAGGQGLFILLEGALLYLKGEMEDMKYNKPEIIGASVISESAVPHKTIEKEEPYGYCTNFLLVGQKLNSEKIRERLESKGQSIVVAGDGNNVRVHIHTYDPGAILRFATSMGTLHHIQIQNMDDQHEGFKEMQQPKVLESDVSIVAVSPGNGLTEVFKSLGTTSIVSGGQTMNPSVKEILEAVEAVSSKKVIVLPNNKNIVLSAEQIKELSQKEIAIIPSKTIPQGIAALLSFNYEGTLEENISSMQEAISQVKTVEITKSVRSTKINNLSIKEGHYIGIIDDKDIVVSDDDIEKVLFNTIKKADIDSYEVITLYYGSDVNDESAEKMADKIRKLYSDKQVEVVNGGQPHYYYIISLE
jgi:DAK2 domain fusion protein YloV